MHTNVSRNSPVASQGSKKPASREMSHTRLANTKRVEKFRVICLSSFEHIYLPERISREYLSDSVYASKGSCFENNQKYSFFPFVALILINQKYLSNIQNIYQSAIKKKKKTCTRFYRIHNLRKTMSEHFRPRVWIKRKKRKIYSTS